MLSLFQNAPPKKKSTIQKIQNDPIQDPNPNDDDLFDQEDSEEDIIAVIFVFLNELQRRNRIRYRNLYTDEMEIENQKPNPSIDETVEEESNSMELETQSEGKDPAKPAKREKKTVFGAM